MIQIKRRRNARAAACQRDRVEADVALEVQDVEAFDLTHGLADRSVLVIAQRVRAADERLRVVVVVLAVDGRERVPVCAIGLPVIRTHEIVSQIASQP